MQRRLSLVKSHLGQPQLPEAYAYLTPAERRMIDLLANPDAPVPLTFRQFVARVRPKYVWYKYAEVLENVLEQVVDGYIKRLMIFAPPRLGKSELISRLFSAYWLYRFPEQWVALASYAAELAYTLSRAARANYLEVVPSDRSLRSQSEAVKHWETGKGGGLWAAGIRGPATGKGANLFIVDDPIKDAVEAASEVIQARNLGWNDAVADTRLEKEAARIHIQTRWHEKDYAGSLIERERGEAPEGWHVVVLEAIREPGVVMDWPSTMTVEPDWRAVGESVCPERLPLSRLDLIRRRNPYVWSAMFQQRPTPREGGMFKRGWFEIISSAPPDSAFVQIARWWDLGATEGGGTATAGVKMGRTRSGIYIVLDVVRGHWASGRRDSMIRQTAELDGNRVWQLGPQDPGQAGKTAALAFRQLLDGFKVSTFIESGDKEQRADPLASAAYTDSPANGRVKLVRNLEWNEPFLAEFASFPYGNADDQVDAASNVYNVLSRPQSRVRGSGTRTTWTG